MRLFTGVTDRGCDFAYGGEYLAFAFLRSSVRREHVLLRNSYKSTFRRTRSGRGWIDGHMYADNFSSAAFSALTERAETNSVEMQIVVAKKRKSAPAAAPSHRSCT